MLAVDRIFRYIAGTKHLGLTFRKDTSLDGLRLFITVDASFALHDDRKSHYGITMHLGRFSGSCFSSSKKAKSVTLSSTEAEYMALCEAAKLVAWGRQFLQELGFDQILPTIIYEDNQSTIHMVNHGNDKGRTKHIDIRYHYIREKVADRSILIEYLPSLLMISDILTKPLTGSFFLRLKDRILGHCGTILRGGSWSGNTDANTDK